MYSKIFRQIYDGTLADDWRALVAFQQLLILADEQGVVDMTPGAIHRTTGIPLDIIEPGLANLAQPDQHSRSDAEEGRRIVLLDPSRPWGWRVVNYVYYRNLATKEEKRQKDRERIAEKRKLSQPVAECRTASPCVADVAHTEAELDTEAKTEEPSQDLATLDLAPVQDLLPVDQPKKNLGTTRAREAKAVPLTAEVWAAYTAAYRDRYGVDPVRNAKVNGQLANLVARLGGSEAPAVASFYVRHNFALYVRAKHPADLLLRDCEGLRTEWATGRTVTNTEAQQQDRKQNTVNAFAPLLAEARAREANGK